MGIGAAISAAGTIGGALISGNAAQSAADTQANAANNASATQLSMFNQTRASLQPFIGAGTSAMSQLAQIFGFGGGSTGTGAGGSSGTGYNPTAALSQLTNSPGYQFELAQGQKALDHSAAASGLQLSGQQLQAEQQYGQNFAQANAYQPYINELNTISTQGQNAAAGVGTQATATGQGVANTQLAAGQAAASGQVAQGNILGQATTQLLSGLGSSYGNSGTPVGMYNMGGGMSGSIGGADQSGDGSPYTGYLGP